MTETIEATEFFITSDLNQAAFVLALNHPLLRVEGERGERHHFYFPMSAREDALTFFAGGMIRARTFSSALRDLKALIHGR